MTAPAQPTPGADVGTWGAKLNTLLDWLTSNLTTALGLAQAAETPTGAQAKVNTLSASLPAAYESKIPRSGAGTGWLATLKADGSVYFTAPATGTTLPDASSTVKGLVQLAGALGGTAASPTLAPGAVTTTVLATGAVTPAKLAAVGTATAATFYRGDGAWATVTGGAPGSVVRVLWNGSGYVFATGTVVSATNRQAQTYLEFVGPSDPAALMNVDGDSWVQTPA